MVISVRLRVTVLRPNTRSSKTSFVDLGGFFKTISLLFIKYLLGTNNVPGTLHAGKIAENKAMPFPHEVYMLGVSYRQQKCKYMMCNGNKRQGEK